MATNLILFTCIMVSVSLFQTSAQVSLNVNYNHDTQRAIFTCFFTLSKTKRLKQIIWERRSDGRVVGLISFYNNTVYPPGDSRFNISTSEGEGYQKLATFVEDEGVYSCEVIDSSGMKLGRGLANLSFTVLQTDFNFVEISDSRGTNISSVCSATLNATLYAKSTESVNLTCHGYVTMPMVNITWIISKSTSRDQSMKPLTRQLLGPSFSSGVSINLQDDRSVLIKCSVIAYSNKGGSVKSSRCARLSRDPESEGNKSDVKLSIIVPVIVSFGILCLFVLAYFLYHRKCRKSTVQKNTSARNVRPSDHEMTKSLQRSEDEQLKASTEEHETVGEPRFVTKNPRKRRSQESLMSDEEGQEEKKEYKRRSRESLVSEY